MKIIVPKNILVQAIQTVERLVGKKESLPVLSCILIEASNQCVLRATNLEAGIEVLLPCDIKERGSVAVPATIFSQTIRAITGETVTLSVEDSNIRVEARGTKTLIKTVLHDEFPPIGGSLKKGVRIPRQHLIKGIQAVSYAASPSMIRPELGSILISFRDDTMVCVATDSFRLAEKTFPLSISGEIDDVLIPLKHAGELVYVLERMSGEVVEMVSDDSQITISGDGVRFVSRVIDGVFPNYRDIIPTHPLTTATVLKSDLSDTLRKARVFSGSESQIGFHVYPQKKIFTATAQSQHVGEMSDTIDAALTGEDIDINFHIGYLADCIPAITADSVVMGFAGVGRPLVIRGVSDTSFLYLVMPLNR